MRRRLTLVWVAAELPLPLEDAGTHGGGFGGGDVAGLLEQDGEPGVRERVFGVAVDQGADQVEGFCGAACVFEGTDEGVECGGVVRRDGEGATEDRDGGVRVTGGHVVEGLIEEEVGLVGF